VNRRYEIAQVVASIVLAVALVGAAGPAARADEGQRNWFKADCGSAQVPAASANESVVCISLCGERSASVACIASSASVSPISERAVLMPYGLSQIQVRLRRVSVSELARVLSGVTGWEARVDPAIGNLRLKNRRWRGTWAQFGGLTLRSEKGSIVLTVDEQAHVFSLAPKA